MEWFALFFLGAGILLLVASIVWLIASPKSHWGYASFVCAIIIIALSGLSIQSAAKKNRDTIGQEEIAQVDVCITVFPKHEGTHSFTFRSGMEKLVLEPSTPTSNYYCGNAKSIALKLLPVCFKGVKVLANNAWIQYYIEPQLHTPQSYTIPKRLEMISVSEDLSDNELCIRSLNDLRSTAMTSP